MKPYQDNNIADIDLTPDPKVDRIHEILSCGCPYCGNPAFMLLDKQDGLFFQCCDRLCPACGRRIPFAEADQMCLSPDNATKMMHLHELNRQIALLKARVQELRKLIRDYKHCNGKALDAFLKRSNAAYKRVKDAKVIPDGHDPAFREDFTVKDPWTDKPLFFGTINARRKAKKCLAARLFYAREQAAKVANTLHYYRSDMRIVNEDLSNVESKRDAILFDAAFQKELSLRGTKKTGG